MNTNIKTQFIKNVSSLSEDEIVMLLTHMRTHAHQVQDLKISSIYNYLDHNITLESIGPSTSIKKLDYNITQGPEDEKETSVELLNSPVEDGQSQYESMDQMEESVGSEISKAEMEQLRYNLTLRNLHGTKRLDFITGRNEKINDLFQQIGNLISLMGENNLADLHYIQSLEKSMTPLCNWARQNKDLFSPKQWELLKKKTGVMKTLTDAKHEWLKRKNDNDLKMKIAGYQAKIERLEKRLLQHGIPLQEVAKSNIKDFNQEKALDKLWNIIDTNFEIRSAEDKLEKYLTDEYTGAWMGDEDIIKFYNKAVTTIKAKVSVERYHEKKKLAPSKSAVTKKDIDKWCAELQSLEDKGDYDTYTSKYEEYRKSAASAGYSEYFKTHVDNVDNKKAAGLLSLLDTDILTDELREYFSKDEMELTQEGVLKRYIKAKDYTINADTSKLYDLFQQNVRQSLKDAKEQDQWFNMWSTGLHPNP